MRDRLRKPLAAVFGLLIVTASAFGAVAFVNDDVNSVGGAADHIVQRTEGGVLTVAAVTIGFAAGHYAYNEYVKNQPNTEDLQKADAIETKKEIYDQASVQAANNDQTLTTYDNYLTDTQTIALMEGKNAYIRALENGSAESIARNRATEAVADYYAVKEQNLIASWNISLTVINSSWQTAKNTTDVSSSYVQPDGNGDLTGFGSASYTLVNSSTVEAKTADINIPESACGGGSSTQTASIDSGSVSACSNSQTGISVQPPDSNYERLNVVTFQNYVDSLNKIETQNSEVQGQLDTFINNTYDSYQQGEINTSDLIDPYLGAREYDPETSSTWNLRTLSSMGLNGPQNLSTIGVMNITTDGQTVQGVLMTDEAPAGGFVVNQTYNATALNGSQYVAEASGDTQKLSGNFTVTSAETTDGATIESGETIEYRTIDYQTADTQEFQALQTQLDELTAELNARQQNLRDGGGGVGWLPSGLGIEQVAPIVVALGGALVLLGRN